MYWIELTLVLLIFCFMLSVAMISDLYLMFVTFSIESEHVAKIMLSCHESVCHVFFLEQWTLTQNCREKLNWGSLALEY